MGGVDSGFETGIDSSADAEEDSAVEAGVDSGLDAGVDSSADAEQDSAVEAGIEAGTDVPLQDCDPNSVATCKFVAEALQQTCTAIFSDEDCSCSDPTPEPGKDYCSKKLSRGEFIRALVGQVPNEKLRGFTLPATASFSDVELSNTLSEVVEKAVWLNILPPVGQFEANHSANQCFTLHMAEWMLVLPSTYLVLTETRSDTSLTGVGPHFVAKYHRYGDTAFNLRAANKFGGDWSMPVPSKLLETASLHFLLPPMADGGTPEKVYIKAFSDNGEAKFSVAEQSDELSLYISLTQGESGSVQVGITPESIPVRGWEDVPVLTSN